MKKICLLLLLVLLPLVGSANPVEIDGICYNLNPESKTAEVTSKTPKYMSEVVIPETVNCDGVEYSVTSIGYAAFSDCTGLISITIPNSVTTIGECSFWYCSGLTSIVIPNSVLNIERQAFYHCTGLNSVTIGSGVKSIENAAFYGCNTLQKVIVTDIASWCSISFITEGNPLMYAHHIYSDENTEIKNLIIPEGVTEIKREVFRGCSGLVSVTIPNSTNIIGDCAFYGCSGLTSIDFGNGVKSIEGCAFEGCTQLSSVDVGNGIENIEYSAFRNCTNLTSVIIGDNITTLGDNIFSDCNKLSTVIIKGANLTNMTGLTFYDYKGKIYTYSNGGTATLLSFWYFYKDIIPYEIGTSNLLAPPTLIQKSSTQTTLTLAITGTYTNYMYYISDKLVVNKEKTYKYLRPDLEQAYNMKVTLDNVSISYSKYFEKFKTQSLDQAINTVYKTASSICAKRTYKEGDAFIASHNLKIGDTTVNDEKITVHGLDPSKLYEAEYTIAVKYGEQNQYTYNYVKTLSISTDELKLNTEQPKVVSVGNVIVEATSNLDDEEEDVGFEWRRTDWTDDFTSNTSAAYLYEGVMGGYLRNLNTEKLWKYRPFYESASGNKYYGKWEGIDPTNSSYFDPIVHTYDNAIVKNEQVTLTGYVLAGTDGISEQGFEYWPQESAITNHVSSSVQTITASGQRMTAVLTGLISGTVYGYRAYVKTVSGTTFGEERTFTTEQDITGVERMTIHESNRYFNVYSMSGNLVRQKAISLEGLPRGIYIANGKKIIVK